VIFTLNKHVFVQEFTHQTIQIKFNNISVKYSLKSLISSTAFKHDINTCFDIYLSHLQFFLQTHVTFTSDSISNFDFLIIIMSAKKNIRFKYIDDLTDVKNSKYLNFTQFKNTISIDDKDIVKVNIIID